MRDDMHRALSCVNASPALKSRTLEYLEQERLRRERVPRRRLVPLLSAACVLLLCVLGWGTWVRPVSFVSMDVNPSVELRLNRLDRVVGATGFNQDGLRQLEGLSLTGKRYDDAVGLLLVQGEEQGYLSDGALVSFTVRSVNPQREEQLMDSLYTRASTQISGAQVECGTLSGELWQEAHHNGFSAGKYKTILELMALDSSITLEGCRHRSMSELRSQVELHDSGGCGMSHGAGQGNGHGGRHHGG